MKIQSEKVRGYKSRAAVNEVAQKQGGNGSGFQFADHRPEAIVQRQMQEMAQNCSGASQAAQLKGMIRSYHTQQSPARQSNSTIQRYAEVNHPEEGLIQISESHEFIKPVAKERELWAKIDNINLAASIMSLNKEGILTISPGKPKQLLDQTFYQVIVSDRTGTTKALSANQGSSGKSASQTQETGSKEPFELIIHWLRSNKGKTLEQLMRASLQLRNPFPVGTYANGAFNAIRIQQDLEINEKLESLGPETPAPIDELEGFLTGWQRRISVVNSEAMHKFNFMCTECGGFSKMIMPGKDQTQSTAEVGDRMRVNELGDLPGPWQNHYAAVIMTDPKGDRVTLESAAGMDQWWFGMYGNRDLSQTFIVKTLMAKFQIGVNRKEAGSAEFEKYAQAVVDNSPSAHTIGERLDPGLKKTLDKLLANAGLAVEHGKVQGDLQYLKEYIPAYKLIVQEMPEGDYPRKTQAIYYLNRGIYFYKQAVSESSFDEKKKLASWAISDLKQSHQEVIDDRLARERDRRWR